MAAGVSRMAKARLIRSGGQSRRGSDGEAAHLPRGGAFSLYRSAFFLRGRGRFPHRAPGRTTAAVLSFLLFLSAAAVDGHGQRDVKALVRVAEILPGTGPVYGISLSPDAAILASADFGAVWLWEIGAGTEAGILEGDADFVWGVSWSPDGRSVACASQDGTVTVWAIETRTMRCVLETGWAFCVEWSPDGRFLASGSYSGELAIWDAETMARLRSWRTGGSSPVICLAWSPDGNSVAAGTLRGSIEVRETRTGRLAVTIAGYTNARCDVNGMASSPDGKALATAHQDGTVRVWNPRSGTAAGEIKAYGGLVRGIAWSPDSRLLAAAGQDGFVRVWEQKKLLLIAEGRHGPLPVWSLAWLPDGKTLVSGSGGYERPQTGSIVFWRLP